MLRSVKNRWLCGLALLLFPMLLQADDCRAWIARGDALDAQVQTPRALRCYLEAEKQEPCNAALLCRIAKQYCDSMADVEAKGEKRALAQKALAYAERAVAADPHNGTAELLVAVSYGRLTKLVDSRTKVAYSKLIKQHAEKALALDPNDDLAYYVLGAWNYELANLNPFLRTMAKWIYGGVPAASNAEAVSCFKKAMALNPRRVANYVELGRTYAAMGKTAEARALLLQSLAMPDPGKSDPYARKRAQTALKKL